MTQIIGEVMTRLRLILKLLLTKLARRQFAFEPAVAGDGGLLRRGMLVVWSMRGAFESRRPLQHWLALEVGRALKPSSAVSRRINRQRTANP